MIQVHNLTTFSTIHHPSEIDTVIDTIFTNDISRQNKIEYYNIPCSFDIETTSTLSKRLDKIALMYEWTCSFAGLVVIGRTWEEFFTMLERVAERFYLGANRRLILWVHNLSYEFQFIRKWLKWTKVFSIDNRKPVYAISTLGIEFRCSYILSGYSLAKLGEQLQKYKISKIEGGLDYSLIRNSETELSETELKYCYFDCQVVVAYIQEKIDQYGGDITKLPITKTGVVRAYCRDACFNDGKPRRTSKKYANYHKMMSGLRLTADEYRQLKRAFQGGFTHANPFIVGVQFEM